MHIRISEGIQIIPQILSLSNLILSFRVTIGSQSALKTIILSSNTQLLGIQTFVAVKYNFETSKFAIKGIPTDTSSISMQNALKAVSGTSLKVPSTLSTLSEVTFLGHKENGVATIAIRGKSDGNRVVVILQKSATKTAAAVIADIHQFNLASFVNTALNIDISSVPIFGTLTIPHLGFAAATGEITSSLLPQLYSSGSPLASFGTTLPSGVTAHFTVNIASGVNVMATFSLGKFTFQVPNTVTFVAKQLLDKIPNFQSSLSSLPQSITDLVNSKITAFKFNPQTKELMLHTSLPQITLTPNILKLTSVKISMNVVLQAINIESLQMKGKWVIHGIEIDTSVTYDKETKQIHIDGAPSGANGLSVTDLIKAFSGAKLSVPSVISSLKLTKVVARSDPQGLIVIISATAGSADVYLVFQKTASGSAIAIAADIEKFKLADLIKSATNIDVSGVPFIGPFVISTLAFSVSTNPISHALLPTTYDSDSPLQAYGGTLPKGLSGFFKAEIGGVGGIEVTYAQNLLDFKVPSDVSLSLEKLLSEIPSMSAAVKSLPSPLSDLLACNLVAIRFDPPSKTLSVAAKFTQITIIPNILQVRNLDISLVAILSSSGGLQSLDFNADWILQSTNIRIKVSYDRAAKEVLFAAIPKQGLNIKDLINSLTGTNLPIPSAINSATLVKIIGRKSAGIFTFIFSGSIAGKAGVHLVYQKFGKISHIAIAAGINSFKFADLVQSAVNIDITGIPFFGTFSVPSMGVVISRGEMKTPLLSQVLSANSPLVQYGSTLPNGFTAKFRTPIGSIKGIIGSYAEKVISFTVPKNVDASLGALLSVIPGVDAESLALPSVFGDILKIQLSRFYFDVPNKEMSIVLVFMKTITFFENTLSMTNPQLKLKAKLSTPRSFSAEAKGTINIGNNEYAVDLRKDPTTRKYVISVEAEILPISAIVKEIGATLLPDDLNSLLSLLNFNIRNARIVYPFGVQPQQFILSGTPEMFGAKIAHITAVAIKYAGKIRLIQKYDFGAYNIADFIKKLLGVSLHKLVILDQNVDIEFLISPSTVKGVSLTIPAFKGFRIDQGISIKAPLGWPTNCESDPFCAVAKILLGGIKLSLQATIANARSFTLTATIGKLNLGGGVVLLQCGLQIVVGTNPSIGLVGSIELKDPPITLTAAIRATVGGVKLEGSMSGCWNNAFGLQYLTICNIFLSMTINPSPLPISGLEMGGRIEVGKKSCGKLLTAEGYIGVNALNPSENYFYADVGPVTFQKFFDAFCLPVELPRPLAESGFPKGFKTSFSLLGRELPHARISIPPGFQFRGTLNILGLEAFADILVIPTRIKVKAILPPLRIANILKMYASKTDRSRGPFFIADISTRKAPSIEASGFLEVLGLLVETKLRITTSKYEFSINGKFLNLFNAALRITADYGSFSRANFIVEGWFKNDLFEKIAKSVRDALKNSADEAERHVTPAQNAVKEQKTKFDSAKGELENAKRKVEDAKRAFDSAVSKVDDLAQRLRNLCSIRSCSSGKLTMQYFVNVLS